MGKSFALILYCVCISFLSAQDSLCVFKTNSGIIGKLDGKKKPLKKGDFLDKKSEVYLLSQSDVTLINSKGEAFNLKDKGTYTYNTILQQKAIENQKSLTSKYFKLIWDELLKRDSNKTIIGGVFRGDILMQFPADSTLTASSKLQFTWKAKNEDSQYYIFIRNKETEEVNTFSTDGNSLTLYKENPIFYEGNTYEWSVTTEEFPSLKNIPFYRFILIERSEYEDMLLAYEELIKDLKTLGLSDTEVDESLCKTYGVCK